MYLFYVQDRLQDKITVPTFNPSCTFVKTLVFLCGKRFFNHKARPNDPSEWTSSGRMFSRAGAQSRSKGRKVKRLKNKTLRS